MKVTQAILDALFSQERDSSYTAYLTMETKTSSRVADLFEDLNKGDQSLAALAIDWDSKPIVILDGYLTNRKSAAMVVLTHDLDLQVAHLKDSSTLDKSDVASDINVTLDPSFFQRVVSDETNTNAAASPVCLFPCEWIPFMVAKDSLCLDTLAVVLASKLLSDKSIPAEEITKSEIIKNLCIFLSLVTEAQNSAVKDSFKLGAFSENIKRSKSQAVEKMRESFSIIVDDEAFALDSDEEEDNSFVPNVKYSLYKEQAFKMHHLGDLKHEMKNPMIVKTLSMLARAYTLGKRFYDTSIPCYKVLGIYIHGILIPCSRFEFGKLISNTKMFKDQGISLYRIEQVFHNPQFYANKANTTWKTLQAKQDESTTKLPFMSVDESGIFSKKDVDFIFESVSIFHDTALKKRPSLKDRLKNPSVPMFQTPKNRPNVEECTIDDDNDGVFSDDEEGTESLDRSQDELTSNVLETLDIPVLDGLSKIERNKRYREYVQQVHCAGDYGNRHDHEFVKKTIEISFHSLKIAKLACKYGDGYFRFGKERFGNPDGRQSFLYVLFIHKKLIGVTKEELAALLAATKDYKDAGISEYQIYQYLLKVSTFLDRDYMADVSEQSILSKLSDLPYMRLHLSSSLSLEKCGEAVDSRTAFDARSIPKFKERFEKAEELQSEPDWILEIILPQCQAVSDESILDEAPTDPLPEVAEQLGNNDEGTNHNVEILDAVPEVVPVIPGQRPSRAVARRTNEGISNSVSQLHETAAEEAAERKRKRQAVVEEDISDDEDSSDDEEEPRELAAIELRRLANKARNLEKLTSMGLDTYDTTRDYSK
ncbi:predicted protein [Chaetoceros tenuissimus]|uniref:Uncharacterized protein n=1 Tax=Chaetoceros tenuissimus TaxID=426638 RepID=A0AAD3D789_9STRA|nr:predicted protein [Chaetoceros tenuissimus]